MIRIAINGFGRIGRNLFRLLLNHPNIEVIAINDIADNKTMAHLIKYDSIHGVLPYVVSHDETGINVDGKQFLFFHEKNISNLDWKSNSIDYVIESTGKYKTFEELNSHIFAGAKKVILSAPSEVDSIKTVVLGVNENILDGTETILSNASCTTNNAAPMIKIIDELCGIEQAYITTIHSFTTDQSLHDQPHKDLRRARAAALSMIPTTTGAAKAISEVIPSLAGKLNGFAVRVPTPNVSLVDVTFELEKSVTAKDINSALKSAAEGSLKGILGYSEEPLVSCDYNGCTNSSTIDAEYTTVIGENMVKVLSWYDNEAGFSNRMAQLTRLVATGKL